MQPTDVVAVIVSYQSDDRLFRGIDALAPQVDGIVVVENGSADAEILRLKQITAESGGKIRLISNAENVGLATAQNQGIRAALEQGAGWVLLMDNDSVPAPDMVPAMLAAYLDHPAPARLGLLAPRMTDAEGTLKSRAYVSKHAFDFRPVCFGPGEVVADVAFAMASGSLVKAEVFREVGLMRDDFFVDYIDFEFTFRMRRGGWNLVAVGDATLEHRLGEFEQKKLLGRTFRFNSHSGFRRYYIYRNRMRVWWAHGFRLPAFFAFEAASITIDLAKLILLEDQKMEKLGAIGRGVVDAMIGRGSPKAG